MLTALMGSPLSDLCVSWCSVASLRIDGHEEHVILALLTADLLQI